MNPHDPTAGHLIPAGTARRAREARRWHLPAPVAAIAAVSTLAGFVIAMPWSDNTVHAGAHRTPATPIPASTAAAEVASKDRSVPGAAHALAAAPGASEQPDAPTF